MPRATKKKPAKRSAAARLSKGPGPGRLARGIVTNCLDAIIVTSPERLVVDANQAAAHLFGLPLKTLIGTTVNDLVAPQQRRSFARYEREVSRGHPHRYETTIVTPEGDERIVAVASAAIHRNGKLLGTGAILRDITEERHAHDKLARSEARYRNLIESASDGIVTFDATGLFTTVNRASEGISGYKREEIIGQPFASMLPDEELPKALREFQKALAGHMGQFETSFYRKDGEIRHISVTYSPSQRGEEVLCLIRDVTEERQLQEQLIQSEKMAAIGQLVSGVAHELNNPLASLSAFAQLLLADRTLTAEQRQSAEIISKESLRSARIVNNLLTFARQHTAEKVAAGINQVLDDTLELRAYELKVRGIDLVRQYDSRLPVTMADVYQLQQVFLNLITNAEHAMDETERFRHRLTVRTRALPDLIRIEIEDTGPGIPQTLLERVFNPFYTTKPTGTGTGLGLSISLGIVSEHGGRVWAENVPTTGARFCVELPVIEPTYEAELGGGTAEVAAPRRLRILVVDDEEPLRIALERHLTSAGHEVALACCGTDALDEVDRRPFDAIIVDMRMPDMSGQQLYERLREERLELAQRVIFTTGDTVSPELRKFVRESRQPFIPKPFEFGSILQVLPQKRLP